MTEPPRRSIVGRAEEKPRMDEAANEPRTGRRILAWSVHLLTATGAVLAFLSLLAVWRGDFALALWWLVAALAVDAFDGSLARAAHVKTLAPRIDGDTLDLIIDYLTFVFVPAAIIVGAGLVPAAAAPWLAALILVSSLYNFTRRDLKTEDNYFRGFPANWNVVAFYLYVARPDPELGAAVVAVLAAATFAPIHFVHPFRVRDYGRFLPAFALAWAAVTAALLWPDWNEGVRKGLLAASLAGAAVLVGLGLIRTFRGPRPTASIRRES
jgi:phosphatidylcholine synthase